MITVNDKALDYSERMTLSEALERAGRRADNCSLTVVNGELVTLTRHDEYTLHDGDEIAVMRIVSGG